VKSQGGGKGRERYLTACRVDDQVCTGEEKKGTFKGRGKRNVLEGAPKDVYKGGSVPIYRARRSERLGTEKGNRYQVPGNVESGVRRRMAIEHVYVLVDEAHWRREKKKSHTRVEKERDSFVF